jgi:hypothetical protein
MSHASTDSQVDPGYAAPDAPAVSAALPFVQLSNDPPNSARLRVQVHYDESDAVDMAQEDTQDEFYDCAGHTLTLFEDKSGLKRMRVAGKGDADEVKRRLIAELRAGAERSQLAPDEAVEAEAVAVWLEASPSLEQAVHGIGLAELVYVESGVQPADDAAGAGDAPLTTRCRKCNANQKRLWGMPPCCGG